MHGFRILGIGMQNLGGIVFMCARAWGSGSALVYLWGNHFWGDWTLVYNSSKF